MMIGQRDGGSRESCTIRGGCPWSRNRYLVKKQVSHLWFEHKTMTENEWIGSATLTRAPKARRCLPGGYHRNQDVTCHESRNGKPMHANMSSMHIMDRMCPNRVGVYTILRESPSQDSGTSHRSRHSRPPNGLRKGRPIARTSSKYMNTVLEGKNRA